MTELVVLLVEHQQIELFSLVLGLSLFFLNILNHSLNILIDHFDGFDVLIAE